MIRGQILWDMRAFQELQKGQSDSLASFLRDFKASLKNAQWLPDVTEVG